MDKNRIYELLSPGIFLFSNRNIPRFSPRATKVLFDIVLKHFGTELDTVYDPMCGNGISACTLQAIFSDSIDTILASDITDTGVAVTGHNLNMITAPEWINYRIHMLETQGDPKSERALRHRIKCAELYRDEYQPGVQPTEQKVFKADVFNPNAKVLKFGSIDLIMTDPPYSRECVWDRDEGDVPDNPVIDFLDSMKPFLSGRGAFALMFDRGVPLEFPGYDLVRREDLKKRDGYLLVPRN